MSTVALRNIHKTYADTEIIKGMVQLHPVLSKDNFRKISTNVNKKEEKKVPIYST
ncbi:hypothetical protein [Nostoc sp.]|uniref:hypothetical protein n=1 Tax=Nostoc sp. TaxID=1180 RepID=UPI002FF47668